MFTNGKVVLAGFHPKKGYITGIGGKTYYGEALKETAFREMLEELFLIEKYPTIVMEQLMVIEESKVLHTECYANYVFSFEDLTEIIAVLKNSGYTSPLYEVFPSSIEELVLNRRILCTSEISHLTLLPVLPKINIAHHFLRDILSTM